MLNYSHFLIFMACGERVISFLLLLLAFSLYNTERLRCEFLSLDVIAKIIRSVNVGLKIVMEA